MSSNSIRTDGVYVSSYCPLFMFQRKSPRNNSAMVRLIEIKMMMMVISVHGSFKFITLKALESGALQLLAVVGMRYSN